MLFFPKFRFNILTLFLAVFLSGFFLDIAVAMAVNVPECSSSSGCRRCTACCTENSVDTISENLFNTYRQDFIMDTFYTETVEPSFKKFADEIRNAEIFKTATYGAFLDASILMDTLRDLQISTTKTLQNYAPSDQICRFGTLSRSLSATDLRVDTNRLVLSEMGLARNLGTTGSLAAAGRGQDNLNRLHLFAERFCSLTDNASGLNELCLLDVGARTLDLNEDRDIDFTRSIDTKQTINGDFTDANQTQEEAQIVGLSQYLYGHNQPNQRISDADFKEKSGSANLYGEYRSASARRAAAQNTYNTLAAMKMAGSGASNEYMLAVLADLGVPPAEVENYLLGKNAYEPFAKSSYSAQMDILTRRLYQDPKFYANLMDTKTNVRRTSAAIQGVGLMQDRDIYRSMERSEMLLGLMVQLEAGKMANNIYAVKTK